MDKISVYTQNRIESRIFTIRGLQVMIDRDLAEMYGVAPKRLNEQVKRNIERFPTKFRFQLLDNEKNELVANCDHLKALKYSSKLPYAFTEQGVAMLSSILNSDKAIEINIQIMRTFTKLRELILVHKDLRQKIEEIEKKYDYQFKIVFDAIRKLLDPPAVPKEPIGFRPTKKGK